MKTMIAVEIEPDEDGVRCGECKGITHETCWACDWHIWDSILDCCVRGPECLAAEARLRALVEAGKRFPYEEVGP